MEGNDKLTGYMKRGFLQQPNTTQLILERHVLRAHSLSDLQEGMQEERVFTGHVEQKCWELHRRVLSVRK
jgi:hypothetical protein